MCYFFSYGAVILILCSLQSSSRMCSFPSIHLLPYCLSFGFTVPREYRSELHFVQWFYNHLSQYYGEKIAAVFFSLSSDFDYIPMKMCKFMIEFSQHTIDKNCKCSNIYESWLMFHRQSIHFKYSEFNGRNLLPW